MSEERTGIAPDAPEHKTAWDIVRDAKPSLSFPPSDCTNACMDGPCDCSGEWRVAGWNVDIPALRVLLRPEATE